VAQILQDTPTDKCEQLQRPIGYLVQQFTKSAPESLFALMDEMGREARSKGLTPEILDSILRDENG